MLQPGAIENELVHHRALAALEPLGQLVRLRQLVHGALAGLLEPGQRNHAEGRSVQKRHAECAHDRSFTSGPVSSWKYGTTVPFL